MEDTALGSGEGRALDVCADDLDDGLDNLVGKVMSLATNVKYPWLGDAWVDHHGVDELDGVDTGLDYNCELEVH